MGLVGDLRWLGQAAGALLIATVLLDVFLTVLYARMGAGVISNRLAELIWRAFRLLSKPFGRHRPVVVSFCGPVILVLIVAIWAAGLTLGTALIVQPHLGTDIRATTGPTPTDFVTALYVAGTSIAIVGSNEFTPRSAPFRLLYLVNSVIGMSVFTLTLTYLMQVYNAVQRRNTLGLKFTLLTGHTRDAAELIAGLGPQGHFSDGYTTLTDLAVEVIHSKEAHHFYPVLFYFRFPDAHYAVSLFAMLALDTVTLIKSGLDDQRFGWLKESGTVSQLWEASMMMARALEDTFLGGAPDTPEPPDAETRDRWKQRYAAALDRLQQAGIETMADEQQGAAIYVALRAHWDAHIRKLAPAMLYQLADIDPAGCNPQSVSARQDFKTRLHSAG
jgi:hypothetical protein